MRTIILILALLCGSAQAADVAGTWKMDTDALRAQIKAMMDAQMAQMPENMRPQMLAMMDGMMDKMVAGMSGTAEFAADGTAVFTNESGETDKARWEDRGDRVLVMIDDPDAEPVEAAVEGNRMVYSFKDEEMPMPMEIVWLKQ